jgi:hypothetical protein
MEHYYTLKENVLSKYKNNYFFETGTYLGDSVELALKLGFDKVISIEIDADLQKTNFLKFEEEIKQNRVSLIVGDTLLVMEELVENLDKKTTFWLDAHVDLGISGLKRCPLYDEIRMISKSQIKDHTILIDDLRCFGGGLWGEGIHLDEIKRLILEINEDYKFSLEDGHIPNDILVAYV